MIKCINQASPEEGSYVFPERKTYRAQRSTKGNKVCLPLKENMNWQKGGRDLKLVSILPTLWTRKTAIIAALQKKEETGSMDVCPAWILLLQKLNLLWTWMCYSQKWGITWHLGWIHRQTIVSCTHISRTDCDHMSDVYQAYTYYTLLSVSMTGWLKVLVCAERLQRVWESLSKWESLIDSQIPRISLFSNNRKEILLHNAVARSTIETSQ